MNRWSLACAALLVSPSIAQMELPASTASIPAYSFEIALEPSTHLLSVHARIFLPPSLAGRSIEFLLNDALVIEESSPEAERLPSSGAEGFVGINGSSAALDGAGRTARYRVVLAAETPVLRLRYRGAVNAPLTTPPEESARSFSETTGLIDERGVYLAGSTLWYPYLGDGLFTFELTARAPEGWHLISPGEGTSREDGGIARWHSPLPLDELHLVGGPLTRYATPVGGVEAQVYLRKPDEALAGRYLEATARDLEMYRALIGPYPYAKFALVENFWETGYGMPSFTLLGPQIIRFPFILASSYPHEILHNWWGNSVFVDYDTGNWCEGLTAYMADHLFKEQQGQGAEYRRDTLKRYRDYVREGRDFPLVEFRSRHSAATEAVGYGKTLMGFHMLRRQMGDEAFRRALALFYRSQRGRRASFGDVRAVMEKASGQTLGAFFEQWVQRAGAPELRLENVKVERAGKEFVIRGDLVQAQQAAPWSMQVPVTVRTASGVSAHVVAVNGARTAFELREKEAPLLLEVDPEFDVFRVLDARETAPSLGQIFGEPEILAVLPASAPPAEQAAYRAMLESWDSAAQKIEAALDRELGELPADRAVWIVGRGNALAASQFASDAAIGLEVSSTAIGTPGGPIPFAANSSVVVKRHPRNPAKAIGWITVDPLGAAPGLARKLPHYGKYSFLGFAGDEPTNTVKGEWPTSDSPLRLDLRPAAERAKPLPAMATAARPPLAELPPAFSEARLLEHVRYLAAPEREGRGLGTRGLEASQQYLAGQFRSIGLKPASTDGSYLQAFEAIPAPGKRAVRASNVIGVLPGANPAFAGQAVIVSAHYDHLGRDGRGVRVDELGQVHPGADDNASGVAVLLELARAFASSGAQPRTIVFIAFSAEESGLLGSKYYVEHPLPVPLAGIRAVVNLDTVGRLGTGEIRVLATGSASEWPPIVRGIGFTTGLKVQSVASASSSSDQQSFIDKGIPGVQIFTGAHLDYHRPTDTADKIDGKGMVAVATAAKEMIGYLAERPEPLTAKGSSASNATTQATRRVSFGVVPDFAYQGPGVRADSIVPDSPAAQAGLRAGDIVRALNGAAIEDLAAFSESLKTMAAGQTVKTLIDRAGSPMTVEVVVTAR